MDATRTTPPSGAVTNTPNIGSAPAGPDAGARARGRWSCPTARFTEAVDRADVDDAVSRVVLQDGRMTVLVSGELDLGTAPVLTSIVDRHLRTSAPGSVEFDLGQVTFMDCAGVSVLLHYSRRGVDPGCTVTLTHVPTRVRRLFDLAGLTPYFHFDNRDDVDETGHAASPHAAA